VVAQAVGLDDQAEVRPEEVDSVSIDSLLGERLREPGPARNPQESLFELGVGEGEGRTVENFTQHARAWIALSVARRGAKLIRVDEIELVGFIYRSLHLWRCQLGREIDQSPAWSCGWNVLATRDVGGTERRPPVDANAPAFPDAISRYRDAYRPTVLGSNSPKGRGVAVTQHSTVTARENGGHPPAFPCHIRTADGVDPGPDGM
jgi:hypothetical protein